MSTTDSFISTVTGRLDPAELDYVDAHDHLVAHAPAEVVSGDADLLIDDADHVLADLHSLPAKERACIVEMTTVDYGRDAAALKRLSSLSGVKIVSATGFNVGRYSRPYCEGRDPDELAETQIRDVLKGVAGIGVRCGVVKFATGADAIAPWEEVAARAAARTHRATGCPIFTHTQAGRLAPEQLDLLAREDVPPSAVVLGHMDRNPDLALHQRLARAGAYLSYDQVPKPKYATEQSAIELILALARDDLHTHVVIGGDFARRSLFTGYGGSPGLSYIPTRFAAHLHDAAQRAGLDGDEIVSAVLQRNPRRAVTFRR